MSECLPLFSSSVIYELLIMCAAEQAEWGTVNALIRTCKIAKRWVNKDGQPLDGWVGAKKRILEALGPRCISAEPTGICYYARDQFHRINGPACTRYKHGALTLEWYEHGRLQKSVALQDGVGRVGDQWPLFVPPALRAKYVKKYYWCPLSERTYWYRSIEIARYQQELDEFVTIDASNRAIYDKRLAIGSDSESQDESESESSSASERPIKPSFYQQAYAALDNVNALRKQRKLTASTQPRKKRLRKRCADEDSE